MTIEQFTAFLGWCTLINVVLLALAAVGILTLKGTIAGIHSRMFGVDEAKLPDFYFAYLGNYKIAVLVLNLVPYIALKMMA